MFRTQYFIVAIGLPLLCASCSEDAAPPSGPRTEPPSRASVRASATAVARSRFQIRQAGADAAFAVFEGCVETNLFVFAAEQAVKEGPGKPTTGPLAVVSVFEIDRCTGQFLRAFSGATGDAVFQANQKLTEARLQATITTFDDFSGVEEGQVELDLTWTGTGELVSQTNRSRIRTPGLLVTDWFKGTFRPAATSGSVTIGGKDFGTDAALFADIFRARLGHLELVRTT